MRVGIMSASTKGAELRENERLLEEIAELGHEGAIINYRRTAVAVTEEGRFVYQYDDNDRRTPVEVDAVIPRIGKYVEAGSMVLQLMVSNGVYSTASPEAVRIAKNKMATHIVLDMNGVPTPYCISPTGTRPDNPYETLKVLQPDARQPVIIKTTLGSHGRGVILAESRRSAKSQAQALQASRVNYLMQEFAEAPEATNLASDIRLVIVEGNLVAAMKRTAKDEDDFRSNLAQGGEGEPYEPTPREIEIGIKACEAVGLHVAGVDLIPSKRGPLVNEVNVSPEFGIEKVTGVNVARVMAEMAIRGAESRTPPPPPMIEN
jgi:ribosomal protein S6--L-glutamate ligase